MPPGLAFAPRPAPANATQKPGCRRYVRPRNQRRHANADSPPPHFRQTPRSLAPRRLIRFALLALPQLRHRPRQVSIPFQRIHRQVKVGVKNQLTLGSTHKIFSSISTSASPTKPMLVSSTVHVLNVCVTVKLKLSFTNQNPPSFTCEKNSDPAPIASTSNSRCTIAVPAATGARIADAIVIATVAEPTATRIDAATSHPKISGDTLACSTISATASPAPLRSRILLNPRRPPRSI